MTLKKFTLACLSLLMMSSLNISANTCCPSECCGDWTVHADWLYWNVRKCGLDYAWREEFVDNDDNEVPNELGIGKGKHVDPCYDSGFRIGFFSRCDDWHFGVRYTHYENDEKASFFDGGENYQNARVLPGTRNDSYDSSLSYVESNFDTGKSKYDIEYKVLDVEGSRSWEVNCEASLNVFAGFRYACIDQDLKTQTGNEDGFDDNHTAVREKNDMSAYGIYIGGEGSWNFCDCYDIFGRFSVGTFVADVDRSFHQFNINDGDVFEVADVKDCSWCHVNALEFAVGLNYELRHCLCADWFFSLGYEFHTWFNMQDFINFCGSHSGIEGHPARQKDSIGFDGLFVRVGATF